MFTVAILSHQEPGFTEADAVRLINMYGDDENLYLHGFEQYLITEENSVFDPELQREYQVICNDFVELMYRT